MLLCTLKKVGKDLTAVFCSLPFVALHLYLSNANEAENIPKIHSTVYTVQPLEK